MKTIQEKRRTPHRLEYGSRMPWNRGARSGVFRITDWCEENGIELAYIQPGKSNQNADIERFNRSFCNDLLGPYLFTSLSQVREMSAAWMISYNGERPHDSLGRIPPAEFRRQIAGEVSTFKLSA